MAVIGVGRIGLCLALNLERAGHEVLGVDKDAERVARINGRTLRTSEPGVEESLLAARAFHVVDDLAALRRFAPALVFVAVDTATRGAAGYDHGHLDRATGDLFAAGPPPDRTDLVLVCTTMPGYGDSKAASAEACGYALSYSPGFVAQGSIMRDQQWPSQVLIGEADQPAGERIERVYRRMCRSQPSVHRMSRLSAEIAKLATNSFLTMKIAFANAIGDLAVGAGADPEQVLAAVGADVRIGSAYLRYGFGYGGPCFPRDNRALNAFARQHERELLQAGATDEMNRRHLAVQVGEYLRAHRADEPIHFESLAYKPGTEMLEESQVLALAVQLARAGRRVVIRETPNVLAQVRALFGELFEYDAEAGARTGLV